MTNVLDGTAITTAIATRGITRLIHFTSAQNLPAILRDGRLRSAKDLGENHVKIHAENDSIRLDGQPDKICCSIEYPNVYYLNMAKKRTANFPDWVALLLDPECMTKPGVLFSPSNAAGASARLLSGLEGFDDCYSKQITTNKKIWTRRSSHALNCPTDLQAEVLVPGPIPLSSVLGIVLPTEADVGNERERLRLLGVDPNVLNWSYSPGLFDADKVRDRIWFGSSLPELAWNGRKT